MRTRYKLLTHLSLALTACSLYAQTPKPDVDLFAKYAVQVPTHLGSAKLNFSDHDIRMYRTRLRYAAIHGVVFAGHYRAAIWGCGSGCIVFSIIDVDTGNVSYFPGSISQVNEVGERLTFHKNSRVVHIIGSINEGDSADRWYVWNGKEFKLIAEKPSHFKPDADPAP